MSVASNESEVSVRVGKGDCPSPHSVGNKIGRVAWAIVWGLLFRPSPRILFAWRRFLLRCFGATIGSQVRISSSVRIWAPWNLRVDDESSVSHDVDLYCVDHIHIGAHATVSQYAMLCTASHDISDPHMRLTHSPIEIADQAWVCARAFVAPGVTIGTGAVVGACSVVTKDVKPWAVVAGNPAVEIKQRVLSPDAP
jgi:putative colanic acid biosynthesis acetyltransferase WcaF